MNYLKTSDINSKKYSISEAAEILGYKRNYFFKLLRELGFMNSYNLPEHQEHIWEGYFVVGTKDRENHFRSDDYTLISPKGLDYIKSVIEDYISTKQD